MWTWLWELIFLFQKVRKLKKSVEFSTNQQQYGDHKIFSTYGDELTPKQVRKNVEDFGKVASTFLLVWGLKSAVSYAVDLPNTIFPVRVENPPHGLSRSLSEDISISDSL